MLTLSQVAKNCFELFDQILDLFSIIGKAIPQFDAMRQSFPDDEQFAIYLSSFYADILDFHLATLKVWRRSGRRSEGVLEYVTFWASLT
jgi:hypothetical protein